MPDMGIGTPMDSAQRLPIAPWISSDCSIDPRPPQPAHDHFNAPLDDTQSRGRLEVDPDKSQQDRHNGEPMQSPTRPVCQTANENP